MVTAGMKERLQNNLHVHWKVLKSTLVLYVMKRKLKILLQRDTQRLRILQLKPLQKKLGLQKGVTALFVML